MDPAGATLLAFVIALYAGLLHGWLHLQRRGEVVHLWLGAAGLVVAALCVQGRPPAALTPRGHALALGLSVVLAFCALRGTLGFLGLRPGRFARTLSGLVPAALGLLAAAAVQPGGLSERLLLGPAPPGLGPVGRALTLGAASIPTGLALLCLRRAPRGRALAVLAVWMPWIAAAGWDVAGAWGLHAGALRTHLGALSVLVAGSALFLRRFVRSMAESERLATHLNELVEERSAALRRKELQLAHGEPLASLGALAAGVAQATDEPIGHLDGNLARLARIWRDAATAREVPRILAECRQGVEQLRAVVSQVLWVARRSQSVQEPVDLSALVASVLPIVQPLARDRAALVPKLASVPPVRGDRRLLGQVALQLLLNAVQSLPREGSGRHRVVVATRRVGDHVELRVEDTGPGIPPEILPRVFDPFFTPEEGERSPALGLAVTHQIVARHRGRLQVASDASGTRVTVELPCLETAEAPTPPAAAQPAPAR